MLTLKPIYSGNFHAVLRLTNTLSETQKRYVASNMYSLAEAYSMPRNECFPFAVYNGETLVGFVMTIFDTDIQPNGDFEICRLMISGEHQGKGYGRETMRLAMAQIKTDPRYSGRIYISHDPENVVGAKLYASMGFHATGEIWDGEVVRLYTETHT